MAEPLKNLYNEAFFNDLVDNLKLLLPEFREDVFLNKIYQSEWNEFELKQRMRHVTVCVESQLPSNYKSAIDILLQLTYAVRHLKGMDTFGYMFIPDFIEQFGRDDFETSIQAMEKITQVMSCEFAVRPFLLKCPVKMMKQMHTWSRHSHENVRRFSSEGCRPRLPWAMAIPSLKKDPGPIIPILENLKNDPSEFVRKSVANNLNDISKDHPNQTLKLAKKWMGQTKQTDRIVKHGCRTLLKKGNQEALELFGSSANKHLQIQNFQIITPKVKIGSNLEFSFLLFNSDKKTLRARLEYGMYYLKANGSLSRKVFKISEKYYKSASKTLVRKKQSFKIITTRKFYSGKHEISIVVNGIELAKKSFDLIS
jgi:3-methyladenine DNA glycosylase AlkC